MEGGRGRQRNGRTLFVACFFLLWIVLSVAILLRYDFYGHDSQETLKNVSIHSNDFKQLSQHDPPQAPPQYGKSLENQHSGNDIPVLQTKTYTRRPGSAEWQLQESQKVYPFSSPFQMHGHLPVEHKYKWQNKLRFPLSRNVTDIRPEACKAQKFDLMKLEPTTVVIIFCNEDMETLLRSVHSVLDRTPPVILREILLVDDFSNDPEILPKENGGAGELQEYISNLPKVRYLRLPSRGGIVGARIAGIKDARADSFIILDSHIEVVQGWLEPLLYRITESPQAVVMPVIDGISHGLVPTAGGIGCSLGILWKMIEHAFNPNERNLERMSKKPPQYITSPTMAGGLFGANREFFLDVGGYDPGMTYWGTENIELSFRLWQCGGTLECTECSHVHHLFGGGKRYSVGFQSTTLNKMRTMAVWMDQYADLAWHVMGKPHVSLGSIDDRLELRRSLKCRNFEWFLQNVWPESDVLKLPDDVPYLGALKNVGTGACLTASLADSCDHSNVMYFKRPRHIITTTNDESCLVINGDHLTWDWCTPYPDTKQEWDFTSPGQIRTATDSKYCLSMIQSNSSAEDEPRKRLRGGTGGQYTIIAEPCQEASQNQVWSWTEYHPPAVWVAPSRG